MTSIPAKHTKTAERDAQAEFYAGYKAFLKLGEQAYTKVTDAHMQRLADVAGWRSLALTRVSWGDWSSGMDRQLRNDMRRIWRRLIDWGSSYLALKIVPKVSALSVPEPAVAYFDQEPRMQALVVSNRKLRGSKEEPAEPTDPAAFLTVFADVERFVAWGMEANPGFLGIASMSRRKLLWARMQARS